MARLTAEDVLKMADKIERRFRRRFLELVALLEDKLTLEDVEELLNRNRFNELFLLLEDDIGRIAIMFSDGFVDAGKTTADLISQKLGITVDFNQVNSRAVREMERNQLELVREFTSQQRKAARAALLEGVRDGVNPRESARRFKESIGLTEYQVRIVSNYRRALVEGNSAALTYELRDKRFDGSVRRSLRDKRPLDAKTIDKMVQRYRKRLLAFRAETIARTESLAAAHAGSDEAFRQAIEDGFIDADSLIQEWDTSQDKRVRRHHRSMHGQKRKIGETFTSGLGNQLRYPGDPRAPAADRIKCRCAKTTRFQAVTDKRLKIRQSNGTEAVRTRICQVGCS